MGLPKKHPHRLAQYDVAAIADAVSAANRPIVHPDIAQRIDDIALTDAAEPGVPGAKIAEDRLCRPCACGSGRPKVTSSPRQSR